MSLFLKQMSAADRNKAAIAFGIAAVWFVGFTALTCERTPVTGDEALVLSVSASLAERGVLGTRALEGVHGAESHYFLSPPVQHFLHWPLFGLLGPGELTGRVVSVFMVGVLVVCAAVFAWRSSGWRAAVAVVLLLLFWRTGVVASSHGLTLTGVARSVRYDAAVAAWMAASLLLVQAWLARPNRLLAVLLGVVTAVAMLTHFPAWMLPIAILGSWLVSKAPRPGFASISCLVLAVLVICAPYVVWLLLHIEDAAAQFTAVHGARLDAVDGVRALLANVAAEPRRYVALATASPGLGPSLFVAALLAVITIAAVSFRRLGASGRIALVYVVVYAIFLAFLEPTKVTLYALPLFVPVLLLVADVVSQAASSAHGWRRLVVPVMCLVLLEGIAVYVYDARAIRSLRPYDAVAASIAEQVPADARWAGAMRWAWAFRSESFSVPYVLALRAESSADSGRGFAHEWRAASPSVIIDSPEWTADIARLPTAAQRFVNLLMDQCTSIVRRIDDRAYGPLTVRSVDTSCAVALAE